ncbi:MAG: MFS transporter [Sporolactobacillus sp.]
MRGATNDEQGLRDFSITMFGSLLSTIGSQMTQFALVAWVYAKTGSAFDSGLMATMSYGSVILFSIFSGAFVDRLNRKKLIMLSDGLMCVATFTLFLFYGAHHLSLSILVVYGLVTGLSSSIQFPCYLSIITMMVPEDQRSRANGIYQTAWSLATTVAPALAGVLLGIINLKGILIVDLISYLIIICTVLYISIPEMERSQQPQKSSILKDTVEGFRYLLSRNSLVGFVLILTSFNIAFGAYEGLFRPMVLSLTDNNTGIAGFAVMGYGIGNVVSGIFMAIWKGPKNRVPMTLVSWALCGFSGFVVGGFGRSLPIWMISGFLQGVFNNIAVVLTVGIWQSKVSPAYQGRVFGIMRLVSQVTIPVSLFLMTLLSDRIVVPLFSHGNGFWLSRYVGHGASAGMSFVLILSGALFGVIGPLIMFLFPGIRNADKQSSEMARGSRSI